MKLRRHKTSNNVRFFLLILCIALLAPDPILLGDPGAVQPAEDTAQSNMEQEAKRVFDEAWRLAGQDQVDEALKVISEFLAKTDSPELIRKLEPIRQACLARRNEQYNDALRNVRRLADENRIEEALELIEEFQRTAKYPDLISKIEPIRRYYLHQWEKIFDDAVEEARRLADENRIEEALELIEALQHTRRDPERVRQLEPLRIELLAKRQERARSTQEAEALAAPRMTAHESTGTGTGRPEDLWRDPSFRKQFVGSYAMDAAVEPPVSEDERRVLANLLEMMSNGELRQGLNLIEKLYRDDPPALEDLGIQTVALDQYDAKQQAAQAAEAEGADGTDKNKSKAEDDDGESGATLYGAIKGRFSDNRSKRRRSRLLQPGESLPAENQHDTAAEEDDDTTLGEGPPKSPKPRTILTSPSATFAYLAGNICFQLNDLHAATSWYRLAVARFPTFRRAHKNLGMASMRAGNVDTAIRSLTRALELGANDGMLYGLLAYAYTAAGNHLSAEMGYRTAIMLQPANADWKLGLARSLFAQTRYPEAVALCGQLLTERPDDSTLWRLQAKGYLGMEKPMKAAENYEYLRAIGQADAESLNTLGDIYVKAQAADAAVDAYLAAIDADPEQPVDAYISKAKVLAMSNAADAAVRLLDAIEQAAGATMSDDQRKELLRINAWMALRQGDDEQQVQFLEEIVRMDPTDGEALISLGRYYGRTGYPEKAAFYYERAANIKEVEAKAKISHAQLLVRQSKYAEAVPLLKSALRIEHRDGVEEYLKQVQAAATSRR